MKERPIIFNTPMVQAILAGEKNMTRRIVKNIPRLSDNIEKTGQYLNESLEFRKSFCPYGKPGDLLWVRESWRSVAFDAEYNSMKIQYKASENERAHEFVMPKDYPLFFQLKWRPSIHMPKAIARIWLEVEEVRVERVQDISEKDILAEGVRIPVNGPNNVVFRLGVENSAFSFLPDREEGEKYTQNQILKAFWAELWCKINGRKNWDANPWVWVVKFRRVLNK